MFKNRIVQNAKWIIICKVIQSLIQLMIGMLSARYLGPSNYGLINYAAAIVGFAVPIMQLGMGETLVGEYVSHPECEGKILGTGFIMNLVSGLACIVGVTCFAAVANPGESETILVCWLYSLSLLFQASEMSKYWFQAKLEAKWSSIAALIAYIVVSSYKMYILIAGKNIYWFALVHSVEYCFTGIFSFLAYRRCGGKKLQFSIETAKDLFSRSHHYIMANLMVKAFQNAGPIILKKISGEEQVGYYSAATTCCAVTTFLYLAVIDSIRPVILESKRKSQKEFEYNVTCLYSLLIYITLAESIAFVLLARPIVQILYGTDYLSAIPILQILVWQEAFSYMGTIRNIWILGEEKYGILWIINLCGAVASIILNACLIPLWGACGAAVASVLVQIFTNFIMGFILKPIRRNNYLLLRGLNPKYILELLPQLVGKA